MERDAGDGCGCGGGCGVRLSLVDVAGAVEAQDGALRHAEEQQGRRRRDRALQPQREREAIEDDDACRGGRCGVLRHVAARDAGACVIRAALAVPASFSPGSGIPKQNLNET